MIRKVEISVAGSRFGHDSREWAERLIAGCRTEGAATVKDDGSIRIAAEGEEKNILRLIKRAKRGPIFSTVENFYYHFLDAEENRQLEGAKAEQ